MATSFKIEHQFNDISLEKFESHLNHPKLNKMLESKLDFDERKLVDKNELDDGSIEWVFHVKKSGQMPAALKKFIQGDAFAWFETSKFVPKDHCIYWNIKPESKMFKFFGEGVWQLEAMDNGFKRVIQGEIRIDIPFVGRVVENFIVNELKKTYEIEPEIQRQFFAKL